MYQVILKETLNGEICNVVEVINLLVYSCEFPSVSRTEFSSVKSLIPVHRLIKV